MPCFLLAGLPYHLQSNPRKTAVADLHMLLGRELPADSWLYGLGVDQDQRQLLRAMVHGYRDRDDWMRSCAQVAAQLADEEPPTTRLYWLTIPVDAGRAGHSPVGQLTKVGDWIAGRDKDSEASLEAYHRLAHDVITALPEEFAPIPVTDEMVDWFWRHNAFRGSPTVRRRAAARPGRPSRAANCPSPSSTKATRRTAREVLVAALIPSFQKVLRVSNP